ncbi:hypothetical protein GOODEAATRI_005531 [Goodea atripinnis]|uniref:Uncharacterized protein n=1 Tax=Goodea atripinnis TaxID=208336 RepID=A0ABV0NTN1_9TELE
MGPGRDRPTRTVSTFLNLCEDSWFRCPSQNPVTLQQPPGVGYGMNHQPAYNPMQAKAPAPRGPGLYPSGPFQPIPPVGSYQPSPELSSYPSALGQPLLSRPLVGGHPSYTPPLSASPGPRLPPAQATPPPPAVTSASYYPNPPQPMAPAWHYNAAATPMGPASSMSTPPRGPVANHVNPTVSLAAPSPPPHMSHSTAQPSGPGVPPTSIHGYTQPGRSKKTPLIALLQLVSFVLSKHTPSYISNSKNICSELLQQISTRR